jgi:subtilisin family serine protease
MYYLIYTLIAAMLLTSSFGYTPPETSVLVSFAEGKYDPTIIDEAGGRVINEFESMGMLHAIIPSHAFARIAQNPAVEFVEDDGQFEIAEENTSIEYAESWGLHDIGAEPVHSSNDTGKGVKIGVLDTGIDYKHPELAQNYKGGYDFINNDSDPMDDNGHGTHVAGIIAAARDGKGIVGVAPDAELYALKVSDSSGKGSFSGLVEGINWSIDHGIDIVTMSITGEGGSKALQKAVETANNEHNILLLAAVGNGGGHVLYPAAYDQVIGVGSVNRDNALSSFSDTGSQVELVAPGYGIKSTWPGGKYMVMSGTSMATPFVTGAAALLLESDEKAWCDTGMVDCDGKWTNDEIRAVLRDTSKDLGDKGKDNLFGYGLLNLDFPHNPSSVETASSAKENYIGPVQLKAAWFTLRITLQPAI